MVLPKHLVDAQITQVALAFTPSPFSRCLQRGCSGPCAVPGMEDTAGKRTDRSRAHGIHRAEGQVKQTNKVISGSDSYVEINRVKSKGTRKVVFFSRSGQRGLL